MAVAVVVLSSALAYGAGQTATRANPASGRAITGALSGVVVDTTALPLSGVVVSLSGRRIPPAQPTSMVTDAKGRFVFGPLPDDDQYVVMAHKPGYVGAFYGRKASGSGDRLRPLIVVADGQWVRDLRVVMRRPAAISGVVQDDRGEPIVGAYVRALTKIPVGGQTQLVAGRMAQTDDRGIYRIADVSPGQYYVQVLSVQAAVPSSATMEALVGSPEPSLGDRPSSGRSVTFTDPIVDVDALNQIVVGRYPVPPRADDGRLMVYPVTFYPSGSNIADALAIAVGAGDQRGGVDLRVPAVHGARISGVVDGPPESYAGLSVRLMLAGAEDLAEGGEVATALTTDDGRFTLVNVPSGNYVLDVRRTTTEYSLVTPTAFSRLPRPPGALQRDVGGWGSRVFIGSEDLYLTTRTSGRPLYFGRERVSVDGRDIAGVVVTMRKGATISGRYVWEGPKRSMPGGAGEIVAYPAHGAATLGATPASPDPTTADGFVMAGLLPGEYVLIQSLVLGSRLKSVVCGGRDYTHKVIDMSSGADIANCVVTFTDQSILVRGTVRGTRGPGPLDVIVMAFPIQPDERLALGPMPARLKSVQPGSDGVYQFESLTAGDYFVIAVPGDKADSLIDPAFLARVAPLAGACGSPGARTSCRT